MAVLLQSTDGAGSVLYPRSRRLRCCLSCSIHDYTTVRTKTLHTTRHVASRQHHVEQLWLRSRVPLLPSTIRRHDVTALALCAGSAFKTPCHGSMPPAAGGNDWLLHASPGSAAFRTAAGAVGLPCEGDLERLGVLERAAARGDADAQYEVACMLLDGKGVPRDAKFAMAWLECVPRSAAAWCWPC